MLLEIVFIQTDTYFCALANMLVTIMYNRARVFFIITPEVIRGLSAA